jgi:hypothetical protein
MAVTVSQITTQFGEASLARAAARDIQRTHPYFFDHTRVPVYELARVLHLRLEERPDLRQRAQLEIRQTSEGNQYTIVSRLGMDKNVRRFAVAHEIGHFVLYEKHGQSVRFWDAAKQERFANLFASEVLLSPLGREQIDSTFPQLSDPLELLRMASELGLTPYALLTTATENRPLGQDKIWLRIKHIANAYTQSEPKLRIVSAHYDRRRYYIPTNQSITTFAGEDSWLSFTLVGTTSQHDTSISVKLKQPDGYQPKFLTASVEARLSAVRLKPSVKDESYFIILAEMKKPVQQQTAVGY